MPCLLMMKAGRCSQGTLVGGGRKKNRQGDCLERETRYHYRETIRNRRGKPRHLEAKFAIYLLLTQSSIGLAFGKGVPSGENYSMRIIGLNS